MSSPIFEEEGKEPAAGGMATAQQKIEKQARQLAYDTRYQVKKEIGEKKVNPAAMKRLLLQRLQKSTAAPNIKVRAKQMLLGEDYIGDVADFASGTVANALFKVFVEGTQEVVSEKIELEYLKELEEKSDRKYKVRVTDKKTGNSYVRYATREKITQLRNNPNIQSVEMTEYGEPREGERKSGEDTARATGGGAKRDYDGDGKVESGAKEYRGAVHNAIQKKKGLPADGKDTSSVKEELVGNQRNIDVAEPYNQLTAADFKKLRKTKKKGVAEEFLADAATEDQNTGKITGKGVNNYAGKNPAVKIMPEDPTAERPNSGPRSVYAHYEVGGEVIAETGYSKFLKKVQDLEEMSVSINQQQAAGAALSAKRGKTDPSTLKGASREMYDSMTEKQLRDFAKTKHKGLPEKVEEECGCEDGKKDSKKGEMDVRELPTKVNLVKNKMRAMGLKMSYEPEGESVDEARALGRVGRGGDDNPKGAGARVSSGRGMTMTPARGLGASKPTGDDEERRRKHDEQVKKDRRAAAKQRSEEGEDRLSKLVRSVQKNSFQPRGDQIDEVRAPLAGPLEMRKIEKRTPPQQSKPTPYLPPSNSLVKQANVKKKSGLQVAHYEVEGEVIDELRRSEKEGVGSPERREGPYLVGARQQRRERGARGGRHFWSGGEGGSRTERGKSKDEEGSQESRLNPPEKTGKNLQRQARKRGSEMGSRFD